MGVAFILKVKDSIYRWVSNVYISCFVTAVIAKGKITFNSFNRYTQLCFWFNIFFKYLTKDIKLIGNLDDCRN